MATQSKTDLGTLFFGAYRQRVLGLLLLHPDESFHLREIARLTDTHPGTLRRELALLGDAGVLRSETVGNQRHYRANAACPIYEELRSILKKTSGVADVLRAALAVLGAKVSLAFIYGSITGASERRASDIDVMVVGSATLEDVVRALNPCQEQLRREINPHVYSAAEFRQKIRKKDPFISRVWAGPRILIAGNTDEFGKPRPNRKAKAS